MALYLTLFTCLWNFTSSASAETGLIMLPERAHTYIPTRHFLALVPCSLLILSNYWVILMIWGLHTCEFTGLLTCIVAPGHYPQWLCSYLQTRTEWWKRWAHSQPRSNTMRPPSGFSSLTSNKYPFQGLFKTTFCCCCCCIFVLFIDSAI